MAVAVRTTAVDEGRAWAVMTVDQGGHYATEAEVKDWQDVVM